MKIFKTLPHEVGEATPVVMMTSLLARVGVATVSAPGAADRRHDTKGQDHYQRPHQARHPEPVQSSPRQNLKQEFTVRGLVIRSETDLEECDIEQCSSGQTLHGPDYEWPAGVGRGYYS